MPSIIQANGLAPIQSYPLNLYSISYADQKAARSKLKVVYDQAQATIPKVGIEYGTAFSNWKACLAQCDTKYTEDMNHCNDVLNSGAKTASEQFITCIGYARIWDESCGKGCEIGLDIMNQCQANLNMLNADSSAIISRYYDLKDIISQN